MNSSSVSGSLSTSDTEMNKTNFPLLLETRLGRAGASEPGWTAREE